MIDRRAFLEERRTGIGATDAAAVLGLSPWATPLSVYHDKVDPIPDEDSATLPMWLGLRLEDVVAELFTARTGLATRADNRLHRHAIDPWLIAHLDFRVIGKPDELVECKTSSNRADWGDEGTEDVPVHYWTQCQHELAVTRATRCHLAVLFGMNEFRSYAIERDEEFIARWRIAARDFWHDHVLAGVPPPLEGDDYSRAVVRQRWPEHDETLKVLPPERELLVMRLRDEMAKAAAQDVIVETLKHRVEDLIGDALGITGSFGKVTWKTTKDRREVGWEQVAGVYRAAIGEVLTRVNPGDDDDAVRALTLAQSALDAAEALYTTVRPGYRRLDVRWRK